MNDQNKAELRRLAEAQPVQLWSRGAGAVPLSPSRDLMFAVSGPHVVSDYEDWGFTRAAASYIAAACPANVLSLLDENEQLRNQLRLSGISAELAIHDQVGRAVTGQLSAEIERDQLRAEVEALRSCLRETSGVAITMLYDSHPEDVAAEFTVAELHDVVASSAHLAVGNEKVELIYRNAWDLSKAKEGSAND